MKITIKRAQRRTCPDLPNVGNLRDEGAKTKNMNTHKGWRRLFAAIPSRLLLAAALPALVLTACNTDDFDTDNTGGGLIPVSFNVGVTATTRTTDGGDKWEKNDAVGIFMVPNNGTLPDDILPDADNLRYTVTDAATGELAGPTIYYPQSGGNVDFIAYYPHGEKGMDNGNITSDYKYKISVARQNDPAAIDVMYAKAENRARSKDAVALTFSHVLSKVTFNVKPGLGYGGLTGDKITAAVIEGMPQIATLDLTDGSLTPGVSAEITARKESTPAAGYAASFTALIIPQFRSAGCKVKFTADGQKFTCRLPEEEFRAGEHYTYQMIIRDREKVEITKTIAMVSIPAGTFMMGSDESDPNIYPDEKPQHKVTVDAFFMSQYEITNTQFAEFLNAMRIGQDGKWATGRYPEEVLIYESSTAKTNEGGPWNWGVNWNAGKGKWEPASGYGNHPVIFVTWYGADEYARWVGGSLPTEEQWEYACRAGTQTAYSFGDDAADLGDYAWVKDNSGGTTHAVGGKKPNPWGLYDMHGNVYEWTSDYKTNSYSEADRKNPDTTRRMIRGGNWNSYTVKSHRSAYRISVQTNNYSKDTGIRVVFPCL